MLRVFSFSFSVGRLSFSSAYRFVSFTFRSIVSSRLLVALTINKITVFLLQEQKYVECLHVSLRYLLIWTSQVQREAETKVVSNSSLLCALRKYWWSYCLSNGCVYCLSVLPNNRKMYLLSRHTNWDASVRENGRERERERALALDRWSKGAACERTHECKERVNWENIEINSVIGHLRWYFCGDSHPQYKQGHNNNRRASSSIISAVHWTMNWIYWVNNLPWNQFFLQSCLFWWVYRVIHRKSDLTNVQVWPVW